jgi:CheY-like chemotaxis protein
VLVIDDDAAVRDLLQRILAKEGFRVLPANGGEEGLRLARSVRPDAITLDVLMPGMDGWAVLAALKADPALADVPVVMLTIADDRALGFSLGAVEYLTKPVDQPRLLGVLRRFRPGTPAAGGGGGDGAPRPGPVLVVEDDAATRRALRRLLEREGFAVVEAGDGRAALDLLAGDGGTPPCLIVLDLLLPEMDGFEFAAALRRDDRWRDVPIVVLTARDLTADDRRRLNGRVERVLQKGAADADDAGRLLGEVRRLIQAGVGARPGPDSGGAPGAGVAAASGRGVG